jgi:hypothetical protein
MSKLKAGGATALAVLALVLPISGANFILNLVLSVFYYTPLSTYIGQDVDTAVKIFLPFTLFLLGLVFSIILLTAKKEKTLAVTALVLNSIGIVSGLFTIYSVYFAA